MYDDYEGCRHYEYEPGSWDSPPCESCDLGLDLDCGIDCPGFSPVLDEATARGI